MNRVNLQAPPLRTEPFAGWSQKVHWFFFALLLAQFILVWLRLWQPAPWFGEARWPEGLFLVLATASTLASLTRQLPGQNVLLAAAIIAGMGSAAHLLTVVTAMPFGPLVFRQGIGQQLFRPLPWAVPLLWIVVILNARGVARLLLRPWRQRGAYGFGVIGLTALLCALLDFGLEPFATRVKSFWSWTPTPIPIHWYGAPVSTFLGWTMTSLLILVVVTPSLLNKKPVRFPPDYQPLWLWLLLNLLFLTGTAVHHLWLAFGLVLAQSLLVALCALAAAQLGKNDIPPLALS